MSQNDFLPTLPNALTRRNDYRKQLDSVEPLSHDGAFQVIYRGLAVPTAPVVGNTFLSSSQNSVGHHQSFVTRVHLGEGAATHSAPVSEQPRVRTPNVMIHSAANEGAGGERVEKFEYVTPEPKRENPKIPVKEIARELVVAVKKHWPSPMEQPLLYQEINPLARKELERHSGSEKVFSTAAKVSPVIQPCSLLGGDLNPKVHHTRGSGSESSPRPSNTLGDSARPVVGALTRNRKRAPRPSFHRRIQESSTMRFTAPDNDLIPGDHRSGCGDVSDASYISMPRSSNFPPRSSSLVKKPSQSTGLDDTSSQGLAALLESDDEMENHTDDEADPSNPWAQIRSLKVRNRQARLFDGELLQPHVDHGCDDVEALADYQRSGVEVRDSFSTSTILVPPQSPAGSMSSDLSSEGSPPFSYFPGHGEYSSSKFMEEYLKKIGVPLQDARKQGKLVVQDDHYSPGKPAQMHDTKADATSGTLYQHAERHVSYIPEFGDLKGDGSNIYNVKRLGPRTDSGGNPTTRDSQASVVGYQKHCLHSHLQRAPNAKYHHLGEPSSGQPHAAAKHPHRKYTVFNKELGNDSGYTGTVEVPNVDSENNVQN